MPVVTVSVNNDSKSQTELFSPQVYNLVKVTPYTEEEETVVKRIKTLAAVDAKGHIKLSHFSRQALSETARECFDCKLTHVASEATVSTLNVDDDVVPTILDSSDESMLDETRLHAGSEDEVSLEQHPKLVRGVASYLHCNVPLPGKCAACNTIDGSQCRVCHVQDFWTASPTSLDRVFVCIMVLLGELERRILSCSPELNEHEGPFSLTTAKTKTVLALPETQHKLGSGAAWLCHILMGPSTGICLRNLMWHGYVSTKSLSPEYCTVLFHVLRAMEYNPIDGCLNNNLDPYEGCVDKPDAAEFGKRQCDVVFLGKNVADAGRELGRESALEAEKDLKQMDNAKAGMSLIQMDNAEAGMNLIQMDNAEAGTGTTGLYSFWNNLVCQSKFCLPEFQELWSIIPEYLDAGRFGYAQLLLYPMLEAGLRSWFVDYNMLVRDLCKAHVNTIHLTLDSILCPALPQYSQGSTQPRMISRATGAEVSGSPENQLLHHLGPGMTAGLYDEFVWPDDTSVGLTSIGSRVGNRNKLSHGELIPHQVPACDVRRIWFLCEALLAIGCLNKCPSSDAKNAVELYKENIPSGTNSKEVLSWIQTKLEQVNGLRSSRHPVSLLGYTLRNLWKRVRHQYWFPVSLTDTPKSYCKHCTFPQEYCEYGVSPDKCFQRVFVSLKGALSLSSLEAFAKQHTLLMNQNVLTHEEIDLVQHLHLVTEKMKQSAMCSDNLTVRGWCSYEQLGKVTVLRNMCRFIASVQQLARSKFCALIGQVSVLDRQSSTYEKQAKNARRLHFQIQVVVLLCDILLLMAVERYNARADASRSLPTYLSSLSGSLCARLERQRWGDAPLLAACFAGCRTSPQRFRTIWSALSKRDQLTFRFDLTRYLEELGNLDHVNARDLFDNPMALNEGTRGLSQGGGTSAKSRIKRERKQRRWGGPSDS